MSVVLDELPLWDIESWLYAKFTSKSSTHFCSVSLSVVDSSRSRKLLSNLNKPEAVATKGVSIYMQIRKCILIFCQIFNMHLYIMLKFRKLYCKQAQPQRIGSYGFSSIPQKIRIGMYGVIVLSTNQFVFSVGSKRQTIWPELLWTQPHGKSWELNSNSCF